MPAPLVGLAVGAAARAVAKKVAGNAVKKAATAKRTKLMAKVEKTEAKNKIAKTIAKKPESSVKVVKAQGNSSRKFVNEKEADRIARTKTPKPTSKNLRGTARQDYEVSKIKVSPNVTARVPAKSNYEFAKDMSTIGKIQKQNAGPLKATKAEVKANARGLKAAQKPIKEKPVKKMNRQELNDSIKKQLSNRREQDKRNYPKK
jgi:hypothetical protein